MNQFIKDNKKFLKFYYAVLRLAGWILLMLGLCSYGITILIARNLGTSALGAVALNMPLRSLEFILFGLLGLGIAQLIRYLFDPEGDPGFILRNGHRFIYAYVVLILTVMVIKNIVTIQYLTRNTIENSLGIYTVTFASSIILFAAKALILIGLAHFLKRIIPVIQESKTLI